MQRMLLALTLTLGVTAMAQQPTTAASGPTFEVATIKPSAPGQAGRSLGWNKRRFWAHDTTLTQMVQFAYNVHAKQIVDEPAWFDNETFDIEAQVESGEPSVAQWHTVLQRLLADRLGMTLHHEERVMPAYVLEVAKSGTKLSASAQPDKGADDMPPGVRVQRGPHMWLRVLGTKGSMPELAAELQRVEMDRPVVDKTELPGRYNFTLTATSIKPFFAGETAPTGDDAPPELFTALREQLGLRLEPQKTAVDCLVLNKVAKPVMD
jgi:uncharacterized protein (TIGR03435 family)